MGGIYSRTSRILFVCWALLGLGQAGYATGITADVGLTPPEDRWMFRTQLRYMDRDDPTTMGRDMDMYMVPVVLAYGVRPDVTAIVRQPFIRREMSMPAGDMRDTGRGDLAVIGKYRLLRINRSDYIIGVSPTLGLELPTGEDAFTSDGYTALTGVYFSGRRGAWGADLNLAYKIPEIDNRGGSRAGDKFSATLAAAYQFSLNNQATMSLWPVLELNYTHESKSLAGGQNLANSGEEMMLVSPGLKFAYQSFMLELLLQFPVDQRQNGNQMERDTGGLVGMRWLF